MTRFVVAAAVLASLSTCHAWMTVSSVGSRSFRPGLSLARPDFSHSPLSSNTNVRLFASTQQQQPPQSYGDILLYNSLTKDKQPLTPLQQGKVSMYTCGPTVYDYAHVGNFRAFLTYDILKRILLYFGLDITHVCNLTDVDDKIIARCLQENVDMHTLTRRYEQAFRDDLQRLNIVPATMYPRATEHVDEMVQMIQILSKKGLAYSTNDGSWYFDTQKDAHYGTHLVDLSVDDMEPSSSDEQFHKRHWQDFCLWKATKPLEQQGEFGWNTTIGTGRPGWHLECSAMARKYLGDTIDLHCGGIDLKFPHHENEIAQSQATTGKKFCNCWIHNGFVNIENEKMSKSMGNFLTLQQACPTPKDVRAYRYLVVSSHYRTALSFTEQAMMAAKKALKRIDKVRNKIQQVLLHDCDNKEEENASSEIANTVVPAQIDNFEAALKDDLSMPRAAACLFALVKAAEGEFKRVDKQGGDVDRVGLQAIYDAMEQMDRVFGIFYTVPTSEEEENVEMAVPDEVMELVGQRTAAKNARDWELADSLRARITELGFAVKDVKGAEPIVSPIEQ